MTTKVTEYTKLEIDYQNNNFELSHSLNDKLADTAIETVKKIVKDSEWRSLNCKTDSTQLIKGVFEPLKYYKLLKLKNQTKRIEELKSNGGFYTGYTSSHYFLHESASTRTGYELSGFKILPYLKPSIALEKISEGPSLLYSFDVCTIAYYNAIREFWGDEKFDELFSEASCTPLRFGRQSPLLSLLQERKITNLKKGDWIILSEPFIQEIAYFEFDKKIGIYSAKHRSGDAPVIHALCCEYQALEKQKLVALGLNAEGESYEESLQTFIKNYNETPVEAAEILPEKLAREEEKKYTKMENKLYDFLKTHQFNLQEFKKIGGGKSLQVLGFNTELIEKIAKISIEEAKEMMKQKCVLKNSLVFKDHC